MKDIGWRVESTVHAHHTDFGYTYTFDFRPVERSKSKAKLAGTPQEALYNYLRESLEIRDTDFFDNMPEDMRKDWINRLNRRDKFIDKTREGLLK